MDTKIKRAWDLASFAYAGPCEQEFLRSVRRCSVMSGRDAKRLMPRPKRRLQPGEKGYDESEDWRLHLPSTLRETHHFFCCTSLENPLCPPDQLAPVLQDVYDFERVCPYYERVHLIAADSFTRKALEINSGDARFPRYPRTPMSLMMRIHTPLAAASWCAVRSVGMCDSLFAVLVEMDVVRWLCNEVDLQWQSLFRYIRRRIERFCSDMKLEIKNHEHKGADLKTHHLDATVLDRFEFPFPGVVLASCVSLMEYGSDFVDSVVVPLSLIEAGYAGLPESEKN